MMKFLLFIGFLTTVYFLFFKKKTLPGPSSKDPLNDDTMVPCNHCGTYVQAKEAIIKNGHHYCSSECLKEAS